MGQYWIPVNLDKKEFVDPHKLGSGLKLWEHLANQPGVGAALIVLTAAQREARGGGDLDMEQNWHGPERIVGKVGDPHNAGPGPMPNDYPSVAARTIGRWAGDRIAIVGDYAEDDDLPAEFKASGIYKLCQSEQDRREYVTHYRERLTEEKKVLKQLKSKKTDKSPERAAAIKNAEAAVEKYRKLEVEMATAELFRDVSDDVCQVIEHELQGKFEGDGWREFKRLEETA